MAITMRIDTYWGLEPSFVFLRGTIGNTKCNCLLCGIFRCWPFLSASVSFSGHVTAKLLSSRVYTFLWALPQQPRRGQSKTNLFMLSSFSRGLGLKGLELTVQILLKLRLRKREHEKLWVCTHCESSYFHCREYLLARGSPLHYKSYLDLFSF